MKNLKFLVTTFLLTTLAIGNAWSGQVTITATALGLGNSYSSSTATIDDITFSWADLLKNSTNIQSKKNSGVLQNTTPIPGRITSIVVTHTGTGYSTTLSFGTTSACGSESGTWTGTSTRIPTGDYTYFKITRGANAAYWTSIVINYEEGGGSVDPTITFNNGNYTVGGSALDLSTLFTSNSTGAVTYTVTNANGTGATVAGSSFTATTAGTATVQASQAAVSGYNAKSVTATITVSPACTAINPTLSYTSTSLTVGGTSSSPTITGNTGSGAVTYSSSNTSVATVNASGVVTAVAAGNATITASIAANGEYCSGSATANFTVSAAPCTVLAVPTEMSSSSITSAGATLSWNAVSHASSYTVVVIDADDYSETFTNISGTSKVLTGLNPSTEYFWTVEAVGNGTTYCSSGQCTTQDFTTSAGVQYTITWNNNGSTYTTTQVTQGSAIGTLPSDPSSCSSTYTHFEGWYTTEAGSESSPSVSAPGTKVATTTVPTGNVTYYAVFSDGAGGGGGESLAQTLTYDTWSYSGTTTDKSSYRMFGNGSYIESAAFDLSTLSKVIVYGGTFGGGSYNGISIKSESGDVWKSGTVSGSSQTGVNTFTDGTTLTGTKKLRIYATSGNGTSTGVRISKVEIFCAGSAATGYISSCCTNPAVITLTPEASTINLSSTGTAATTITFGQTGNDGGEWGTPSCDGATVSKTDPSHISFSATAAGTYEVSISYTKDGCAKIGTTTITVTETPVITLVHVGNVELSAMCGGTDTKTVTLNAYNCGNNNVTLSLSNAVSDKFWVTPASVTPTDGKVVDETITLHYTASAGESADNRSGVLTATCNGTTSANSISVSASKNGCVPYTITFINNGSPVASVGGFGGENITAHDPYTDFEEFGLEENPVFTTCADYEFVGWTTEANKTGVSGTEVKPTLEIAKGGSKVYNSISENVTLYALWKVTEGDGDQNASYGWEAGEDATAWTISNFSSSSSYHYTGSQCGTITNTSGSVQFKTKLAAPQNISCYYTKTTSNTNNSSYFVIQISTNGSSWTNVLSGKTMNNVTQNKWEELSASLTEYSDVYVRIAYTGTNATRALDNIVIDYTSGITTYYTNPVCDPKVSVVELCDASVSAVNMVAPVSGTAKATYTAYATNIENATQLKYSITGTDRALFSLDWGSTYPTLSNGAAQQQFTITYTPSTTSNASATLRFYVEDGKDTHSCDIALNGSTCEPLSLSATSTTNSFTINSTTNFGATDTLFIYNGVSVEPGGCGVYPFDSIYCKDCASKGGKYHNLPQGVSSLTINGGAARPVAKGTTYSYYSKHATCQSGIKNITTQMPANVPTISVDHNFWEAIATKGETVTDVVEVTVTNYSGPISFDISGEGASMYSITSLGAGKYRITYTPTNTDPNPATANFHFTEDCTDYRATVALSGMTPSVTVVEVQSNGFTMQTDVEGEPRIMLSYESQEGSGAEKVAEELFFSKYYEATGNTKLIGIFNGTKDTISLANYSLSVGATSRTGAHTGSWNSPLSLSQYGKLAPNQELILWYTQTSNDDNQITSCVTEKGTFTYPLETKSQTISWSGRQSIKLSKNGTPIDLIGAVNTSGSSGIPVAGNCIPDWGDITDGNAIDRAWCALGTSIEDPSNKAYEISTNRCLLIRLNDVVSGANAAENNVGDFTTLGTEWAGRRVEMTAGDEKGIQSSCEGFDYVAGFDYNGYYTQFNPIREDGVNVVKTALIDGGWTATFDPEKVGAFTTYSCKNLKIDINYIQHDGRTLSRDEQEELVEEGEEDFDTVTVASTVYKVPIIVTGNKTTDDKIFHDYSVDTCRTCDVAILSGAVLTKVSHSNNERDSIRDFYVYAGGQFVTDGSHGTYHINALSMRSDKDEVSSAWLAGDLKTTTKKVYHDKLIDNSKSYFFCLPFNCKVSEIKQMNGSTLGTYDEAWGIATYDGASRVTEEGLAADGRNWKTVPYGSTLEAGKGYIIKINSKYPRYVRFPMTLPSESYNESTAAAKEVSIQQYGVDAATNGDIGWNNVGWNLVGNPYLTYFKSGTASTTSGVNNGTLEVAGHYQRVDGGTGKNTWEFVEQSPTEIYVTYPADDAGSTYNQSMASNEILNPFRSFFVQAKANGTLTYAIAKRQQGSSAPMRLTYAAEQRPKIMLTLTAENDGLYDETTLLIGDEYTDEYELGSDLAKWMVAQQVRPQLASVGAGTKLAFNALPNSENINVPLYMLFPKAGNYAIAVNEKQSELDDIEHIYLLYNGDIVADLKSGVQHTHVASKYSASSKYSVRIERKAQEITTPIDQYASDWTPIAITNQRNVRLEQLPMMDAEVSVYDVTGKQLISTSSNSQQTMQLTMPASGFYTIVVNTAFDQFTFKTVVK